MFVRFWGVRGSYPVPGPATQRYGGHTASVEVRPNDGSVLLLDAGTGIRKLGKALVRPELGERRSLHCHVLISHTHWDHIQGLPFFAPLYQKDAKVTIYAQQRDVHLSRIFASQTQDPYFSRDIADVDAEVIYRELVEGASFAVGEAQIQCARLNHPYVAVGYRIEADGGSVAYICDTSPFDRVLLGYHFVPKPPKGPRSDGERAVLQAMREGVVELCRGADLVIYDTMFELSEYEAAPHWGHSAPEHAVAIAEDAGAHCLALFHYHPDRSDDAQDEILRRVAAKAKTQVIGASEGMLVQLAGGSVEVTKADAP